MSNSKACSRCKQIKPLTEFGIHSSTKTGRYSQCLICHRKSRAEQRIRRADKIKLEQKSNYERNREKRIAYANKRVYEDLERHKRYVKNYKNRNKPLIAAATRRRNAQKKLNGIYKISKKELNRLLAQPCFYCLSTERITIDHVIAIARGGTDSIGNLVPACKSCNSKKRDMTIMEWRLRKERAGRPTHLPTPSV